MKICKKCNEKFEDKYIFCPKCKKMLSHDKMSQNEYPNKFSSPSKITPNKAHLIKEFQYEDWNPPSPGTIYCNIKNIPHNTFKYDKGCNFSTVKLRTIKDNLNEKIYCCSTCSYYIRPECYLKNMTVFPKAICKSFEPQPEVKLRKDFL